MTALKYMAGTPDDDGDEVAGIRGQAASAGVYEGFAHVVRSSDDVRTMQPGAVLVVGSGSSSFTMLAPLAAAVIAEGGGMLSHVAIVCREYRHSLRLRLRGRTLANPEWRPRCGRRQPWSDRSRGCLKARVASRTQPLSACPAYSFPYLSP